MDMNRTNFNEDVSFADRCKLLWESYLESKEFIEKLQALRKKGKVEVSNIDYSENLLFQRETYLDAIISLNVGSSLLIDFKSLRPNLWRKKEDVFPVEVVSNPTKFGKSDGWGYHEGLVILQGMVDDAKKPTEFIMKPVVYRITHKFIEEVVRNDKWQYHPNWSTNGLYQSGFRNIPRYILNQYFP